MLDLFHQGVFVMLAATIPPPTSEIVEVRNTELETR
jgi:hypothetical protein